MGANFKNRTLFHGDNLPVLRGINSDCIDLIATDPPFNKSKDFHATPDTLAQGAKFQDRWSWENDVHPDWLDKIKDDWPAVWEVIDAANAVYMRKTKKNLKEDRDKVGSDMGAFLCFMAVRLIEMHRILKPTGSLYLHCDPTASHYLKALLDGIFDKRNYKNEIIWKRTGAHGRAKRWGPIHDTLLFYTKSSKYEWNRVYEKYDPKYIEDFYRHEDKRGKYRLVTLDGPGIRSGSSGEPWHGVDPTEKGRHWEIPPDRSLPPDFRHPEGYADMSCQERLDVLDEAGLIYWPKRGKVPQHKRYLSDSPGNPIQDIINDIRPIGSQAKERMGYPTQKPLDLYERIITASSNEGDIVLDPFCGCATTPVIAERLGRYWAGVDIWEKAHDLVAQRLHDEVGLFGEVHYTKDIPIREDEGEEVAPFLRVMERIKEPEGRKMSRADMYEYLLQQFGMKCRGCDRTFDDKRYLELDHNAPRSSGGLNHISNRILLCGPCNKLKSNIYTLDGLRRENKKRGYMRGQP